MTTKGITVYTSIMDTPALLKEMQAVLDIFIKHNITIVEMVFNWNLDNNDIKVDVKDVIGRIMDCEEKGRINQDILITTKEPHAEVLFCHENHLHVSYTSTNPLILDILHSWKSKGLIHAIKQDGKRLGWHELGLD